MKKFKRIATFVLSMVMLTLICLPNVHADNHILSYHWYRADDPDGMARYFHVNSIPISSYAEAGGGITSTSNWFVNARTYAANTGDGTIMDTQFTIASYVHIRVYCEHGDRVIKYDYNYCQETDTMVYAHVRATASSTLDTPHQCLVDFVTEHKLYYGYNNYDPEYRPDMYAQYADTETIIIHSEENYPNG